MLTIFSDADFRWSNGFLIRCIRVNQRRFFQIPRRVFIFKLIWLLTLSSTNQWFKIFPVTVKF